MAGFTLIEEQLLAAPATNLTFSTGLSGFTKFRITFYPIKDATDGTLYLRCNVDSGTNYTYQDVTADSTTVDGARATGETQYVLDTDGFMDGGSAGLCTVEVQKPLATTPARITSQSSYMQATGPALNFEAIVGEWANTADLISTLALLASAGDFAIGSRAVLEGAP